MIRVWFKDGTYLEGPVEETEHWETEPDWSHTEKLGEKGKVADDKEWLHDHHANRAE